MLILCGYVAPYIVFQVHAVEKVFSMQILKEYTSGYTYTCRTYTSTSLLHPKMQLKGPAHYK